MAEIPPYHRLVYQKSNYSGALISGRIAQSVRDYKDYLTTLKQQQQIWVSRVRDAGYNISEDILTEFESNPCINSPLSTGPLECIEMVQNSAKLAYIYLPERPAIACDYEGGLISIPDWMCFWKYDLKRFVALDIAPTDIRSTKKKIVAEYHRMGCREVDEDDIEHVLTIPVTDLMGEDECVYYRSRPITFDIIANTPVIPD
ncbi:hypothetical protein M3A49_40870 [Paraburkholderia sp. CNPSo 3076]|uniref:RolB family protein n=1 Tax=Paraburkholderia sp. CNPSo 3076 TaxID=2940936 RepID=UPI00224D61DC|nr:RolB family protein [Paraburkholderia sp. CNPSo 3076]MCX5545700.1 hypothetical protein [Paraburkholderia sp. CNPSo 3076]